MPLGKSITAKDRVGKGQNQKGPERATSANTHTGMPPRGSQSATDAQKASRIAKGSKPNHFGSAL